MPKARREKRDKPYLGTLVWNLSLTTTRPRGSSGIPTFYNKQQEKKNLTLIRVNINCLYSNRMSFASLIADTYCNFVQNIYMFTFKSYLSTSRKIISIVHAILYLGITEFQQLEATLHGPSNVGRFATESFRYCYGRRTCRKEKSAARSQETLTRRQVRARPHAENFHMTDRLTSSPNRVVYGLLPTQTKRTSPSSCGVKHDSEAVQELNDNNNKYNIKPCPTDSEADAS